MLRLLSSLLLVALAGASFCGDSTVPYSVEILSDGQPVLGCARPSCFGWSPNGQPASNNGVFYGINGLADGFIRGGPDSIPAFAPNDERYNYPFTAKCEETFSSLSCSGLEQWVGGIAPQQNVSAFGVMLQCCSLDSLLLSEDRGVAVLVPGQIFVRGEIFSSGVQVGFDYISDVARVLRPDGTLQYDVSVRRMECADPTADYAKASQGAVKAFQAPTQPVDEPLPVPPAQPNSVLEEVAQEEAVQVPAQTQVDPAPLQPPPPSAQFQPPPQQFVPQAQAPAPQYYYPVAFANDQWCFTGDMTVRLIDGTTKRMDELKKNDWVLAMNRKRAEYVQVQFWLHRVPSQKADFNVFETEDGNTIKLTDKHYIFKGDCSRLGNGAIATSSLPQEAVTADQVHVGDCLFTVGKNALAQEVRIVRASRVRETGIYAPMTQSGRIVVNGIHASCHNIVQSHSIGKTLFGYVDLFNRIYDGIVGINSDENVETPFGLSTLLTITDLILPKNIVTI